MSPTPHGEQAQNTGTIEKRLTMAAVQPRGRLSPADTRPARGPEDDEGLVSTCSSLVYLPVLLYRMEQERVMV